MAGARYGDKAEAIRAVLRAHARAGTTTTYAALSKAVGGIPPQGPWQPVLDLVSREELAAGRPDITHLVTNRATGVSGRIEYADARRPTPEQVARAREIQAEVWEAYGARA